MYDGNRSCRLALSAAKLNVRGKSAFQNEYMDLREFQAVCGSTCNGWRCWASFLSANLQALSLYGGNCSCRLALSAAKPNVRGKSRIQNEYVDLSELQAVCGRACND
jgi:hypothetical protein